MLGLAVLLGVMSIGLILIEIDMEAPKPADPYRLDRLRAGEPTEEDKC